MAAGTPLALPTPGEASRHKGQRHQEFGTQSSVFLSAPTRAWTHVFPAILVVSPRAGVGSILSLDWAKTVQFGPVWRVFRAFCNAVCDKMSPHPFGCVSAVTG